MGVVVAVSSALVIGFLAGLLAFRQKSRWCPTCGSTFTCPDAKTHRRIDPDTHDRGNEGRFRR